MNFKKYHVSRNLLDYTTVENTSFATATLISGGITISGRYYVRFSSVSFTVGRSYTMSWTEKSISGTVKIMWRFQYLDGTYSVMPSSGMSLIAEKEVSALLLYVNGSSTESGIAEITNIMLNGDSTLLPYEPYSPDVWHDIPHYVHNTSTDTITTLPAVLYPTGTTATVGLKGNMQQSGTPTPDNPIMPEGTGELETNLAIISGDSQTVENFYYKNVRISDILEAGTYTVSYVIDEKTGNASSSTVGFGSRYTYQKDFKSFTVGNVPITITATVTLETGGCLWARFLRAGSPTNFSYSVSHIRVEKGSHSYGYKILISSANTTTSVYLGEVQTTRRIKKLVLTGGTDKEYEYDPAYTRFYFVISNILGNGVRLTPLYCTHYQNISDGRPIGDVPNNSIYMGGGIDADKAFIKTTDYTSVADLKSYLQQQYANGTPVTVWYVLAEPETGIVNEPLMKIGDYADTVSGITIPTIAGANTLSVDTTLQPSEVSVNYKGWHPVADVHERESGAWT